MKEQLRPDIVEVTRSVTTLDMEHNVLGKLAVIRQAKHDGKTIARERFGTAQVHMVSIKAQWAMTGRVLVLSMAFSDLPPHHYKYVNQCSDCDRRWSQHEVWERSS